MKCPSCGYLSIDKAPVCKKCGASLAKPGTKPGDAIFDVDNLFADAAESPPADRSQERKPETTEKEVEREEFWDLVQPDAEEKPAAGKPVPAPPSAAPAPKPAPAASDDEDLGFTVPERAPSTEDEIVFSPVSLPSQAGETQTPIDDIFSLIDIPAQQPAAPSAGPPTASPAAATKALPWESREEEHAFIEKLQIDIEESPVPAPSMAPRGARETVGVGQQMDMETYLGDLDHVPPQFWGGAPASLPRRVGAMAIDSLLVLAVSFLYVIAAGVGLYIKGVRADWLLTSTWPLDVILPFTVVMLLVSAVYSCSFHWTRGQTPGKKVLSIRLIDKAGGEVGGGTCFLRWLISIVSLLPIGLGCLWALFNDRGLTWHDRIAGTMVVVEPSTTGRAPARKAGRTA